MNYCYFENRGFKLIEIYKFNHRFSSYVYEYNNDIIIIDDNFDKSNEHFLYSTYCEMQNRYMYQYDRVLRFNNLNDDEKTYKKILDLIKCSVEEIELTDNGGHLYKSHFDNTPAEKLLEDAFIDTFGKDILDCLQKEVQISIGNNKTASLDFYVETKTHNYSFEANGIEFHDPLIVGKERYEVQLERQNTLVLFGIKVYRFASNTLKFKDQVVDNLKKYITNKEELIPKNYFKSERKICLYEHQENILNRLDEDRKNSKTTALIVIPTGTGKSQICLEDLKKEYIKKSVRNVLIMVPSIKIKNDWFKRIKELEYLKYNIDISCYNYIFATRLNKKRTYYDYIIVDEAHHALAANLRKTIQYFNPKYLIGLTATPKEKLDDVFGHYEVDMSLKEAIKKGVVTDISCFRLKSNINLEHIRYNGKDYNYADLENTVVVDSRNILIANTLKKYFYCKDKPLKQGIVFCVNKQHCSKMAKLLNEVGLTARAVYGGNSKNDEYFSEYAVKKIQFLCSCQLISEGWDSPQTEIIVMARPTLSKVLYLQQIGRGLRHYENKKCLYLIDVVDNYAAKLTPWSFHSLMQISNYVPFGGLLSNKDYLEIVGLSEKEIKMEEVDIFTFEEKYGNYLSLEQAARELYVDTKTLSSWNKSKKYASLYLPIGNRLEPYFNNDDIIKIRQDKKLTIHNDETILQDFIDFIDKNDLTFSFKLVFILSAFKLANNEGDINLNDLTNEYRKFYLNRLNQNLPVDRPNCIYDKEYLNNFSKIKTNMLDNPFEKYERKRFMYLYLSDKEESKHNQVKKSDLNIISFNSILWSKLTKELINEIIVKELKFLEEYYEKYGGLGDGYKQFILH